MIISLSIISVILVLLYLRIDYETVDWEKKGVGLPTMFILELNSKEKVRVNKKFIKNSGDIIEFSYQGHENNDIGRSSKSRKTIEYKSITFDELLDKLKRQNMYLIGFEYLTENSCCLNHIVDNQGHRNKIDKQIVPVFLSKNIRYCFVCAEQEIPRAIQGTFFGRILSYEIRERKDHVIVPRIRIGKWFM